ncbi:MAG: paraslipin [Myxococcales bacterium]|jgi:regulator of protease activity HflC (stomatin/prohibitin superfamily)|nr:paraslipin [Myxococcales bacterium]
MFFLVTAAVVVVLLFVKATCCIVSSKEVCIVHRLGKFKEELKPGFHLLTPFIDTVAYRQEMREQVIDVPPQSCITRDNIQIEVDGVLYLKLFDAMRASYGIQDYRRACINLAQTTMRSEIGKLTLDRTFSEREKINENIVREIDHASDPWGVKVLRYEIKNITPPHRVVDTLEKQMEAERQKRAHILLADAEKTLLINRSEADRQEAINLSEGTREQRVNEANGRAQEIVLVAEATAQGIERVGQAISRPGGSAALKMRLVEQFVDQLGHILDRSRVSVVPSDLANIKGFFEGMGQVTSGLSPDQASVRDAQGQPQTQMPKRSAQPPQGVDMSASQAQQQRRAPPPIATKRIP